MTFLGGIKGFGLKSFGISGRHDVGPIVAASVMCSASASTTNH
jgi:hypothetical protein